MPLDEATSTFYVKNSSQQVARATLAVVNRDNTNTFESAMTFAVNIDGTTSRGTVPNPGTLGCSMITTGPSIRPGAVQAVDVLLAVGDLQEQVGMNQAASLDFVVSLTETGTNGWVEVCGEQADAEPEIKGDQGSDCERDVVVTTTGTPTCVPTAADAGGTYGGGDFRDAATVAGLAGVLIALGAGLVLRADRRRRNAAS